MSQAQEPIQAGSKKNARSRPSANKKVTIPKGQVDLPDAGKESKGDLVAELWLRFGRFGWDVAGIGLIAFAFITLIGLVGRTLGAQWANGMLISLWVNLIAVGFGWGWPLVVISITHPGFAVPAPARCATAKNEPWTRFWLSKGWPLHC